MTSANLLKFTLDDVDSVGRLDLEGDGLGRKRLDKDPHVCTLKAPFILAHTMPCV